MAVSIPSFLATDAQAYEHFMARWSRRMAGPFLDFVGAKAGDRVLDVGCGTGVISAALAERGCTVVGLDASESYLEGARRDRSHPKIVYELGDARRMPYADASFDACVSVLTIDVIPEVDQVVREMQRVTRRGGTVASGVVDFWAGFSPADLVCDTASVLDEGMRSLRDQRKARRIAWANGQAAIWLSIGLQKGPRIGVQKGPLGNPGDRGGFNRGQSLWAVRSPGLRRDRVRRWPARLERWRCLKVVGQSLEPGAVFGLEGDEDS